MCTGRRATTLSSATSLKCQGGIEGSVFGIEWRVWLTRKERAARVGDLSQERRLQMVEENELPISQSHSHMCKAPRTNTDTYLQYSDTPPHLSLAVHIHSEKSQMTPSPSVCPHVSDDMTSSVKTRLLCEPAK